ncbi:MAG: hypothetical protein D6B27_11645 [Gammaproteobacteria bacterium]|nr:MAG: hypothetical protein D6B27_11645 [Gammaproteobacteria bacterium]
MMKCKEFKNSIFEYLDQKEDNNDLSFDIQAFHKHREECKRCRKHLENEEIFLYKLKQIPAPQPSAKFRRNVLKNAVKTNSDCKIKKNHLAGFATGFASAITIVVLVLLIYINTAPETSPQQTIPEVKIALFELKDVNLVFNVPQDFKGATLSMELSSDYELAGYPNQSKLEWQTDLVKGQNFISLPVVSTKAGKGELIAKIRYGNKEKTFKLNLLTIDTFSEETFPENKTG